MLLSNKKKKHMRILFTLNLLWLVLHLGIPFTCKRCPSTHEDTVQLQVFRFQILPPLPYPIIIKSSPSPMDIFPHATCQLTMRATHNIRQESISSIFHLVGWWVPLMNGPLVTTGPYKDLVG